MKRFLAIMVVLAAGCGHGERRGRRVSDEPQIISEDVRAAVAHPDDAMTRTRSPLGLDNGTTVRNCTDYLAAQRAGAEIAEFTEARLVASEYVVCDVMDALRCAARGAQGPMRKVGQELADRLDLRQIRTSLGPRLDDRAHTLATLGDALQTTDIRASLTLADWTFVLSLAAVADVDGDGRSDWIVSLADEARTGSYRDYGVLVVLDPERPGPLRVQKWPPKGPLRACRRQ